MLILFSSKFRVEKILCLALRAFKISIPLIAAFFLFLFWTKSQEVPRKETENTSVFSSQQLLDKIGHGPLAISSSSTKQPIPDLSREVFLLASNLRPGVQNKDAEYILLLQSSQESFKLKQGERIFLSCDPGIDARAPVYHFSEQKTPLWIRPVLLEKHKTLLEVGLFLPARESEGFQEEKNQFLLKEKHTELAQQEVPNFVQELENGKLWGHDIVLTSLAGEGFKALQNTVKVEIPTKNRTVFCFLSRGDCLAWGDEGWTPIAMCQNTPNKPIAQVSFLSPRSIEFEVWDREGFSSFSVKLDAHTPQKISFKPDLLPHGAKMRTSKQLSCNFGKKRYLVREGDWMLKTARGWKNLKRKQDREDYFFHKLSGELLILQSLVMEQGKIQLKGLWVDPMRTQSQPFSIPVVSDLPSNKTSAKNTKKSSLFYRNSGNPTTYLPSQNKRTGKGL